jgi:hypothetical protein
MGPGESIEVLVRCDIAVTAPAGMLQLQVDESGIDVRDATGGGAVSPIGGTFPFSSGLAAVKVPAEQILFSADPVLPANVTGGDEVPVFDLRFDREGLAGGTDVLADGFRFEVLGPAGMRLDPALVIESARFDLASWAVPFDIAADADGATVLFAEPPVVPGGGSISMRMSLALKQNPPSPAFAIRIAGAGDIYCRDALTNAAVEAASPAGAAFPFSTGLAAYLGSSIAESFSNYPNPFVASREPTKITFRLSEPSSVTLEVYTVLGDLVARISDGERLPAGLHQDLTWNGRNGRDEPVLNGVYYLVLRVNDSSGEQTFRRKVALVR